MKTFLKKILAWFGRIPQDKLLHFIAGFLIYFIMFLLLGSFIPAPGITKTIAFIVTCVCGILKEFVVDRKLSGSVEWADSNTTTFGAIIGLVISSFI